MLASENEKLVLKVEDLRNDVKLNEEALTQYTVQQNLQLSNSKQESAMLSNTLDKERVNRDKIQSEVGIKLGIHFQGRLLFHICLPFPASQESDMLSFALHKRKVI